MKNNDGDLHFGSPKIWCFFLLKNHRLSYHLNMSRKKNHLNVSIFTFTIYMIGVPC